MICDTSGLIAALSPDQPFNDECIAAVRAAPKLIVSPMVLAELDQVIMRKAGVRASIAALREFSSTGYDIPELGPDAITLATNLMETHSDIRLGLTDASLVVLAKRYNTNEILTLDQHHFRPIRGLDGKHFKLLPLDAGLGP